MRCLTGEEVMAVLRKGSDNRRLGETNMNRESSRSHAVFTCTMEAVSRQDSGLTNVRYSRINLIDLAGGARSPTCCTCLQALLACCLRPCMRAMQRCMLGLGRPGMIRVTAQSMPADMRRACSSQELCRQARPGVGACQVAPAAYQPTGIQARVQQHCSGVGSQDARC